MLEMKLFGKNRTTLEVSFMTGAVGKIDTCERLFPNLDLKEIGIAPLEISKVQFRIEPSLVAVVYRTEGQDDKVDCRETGFVYSAQPVAESDVGPRRSPHLVAVLVNDPATGKPTGNLLLAPENGPQVEILRWTI